MSRPAAPIICDGCGKAKQEANRWWQIGVGTPFILVVIEGTQDVLVDLTYAGSGRSMGLLPLDFCGEACALKFISEQMGKVNG